MEYRSCMQIEITDPHEHHIEPTQPEIFDLNKAHVLFLKQTLSHILTQNYIKNLRNNVSHKQPLIINSLWSPTPPKG